MMLQIRDLRVRYGSVEVLKGVDLDVGEGSLVTVVGANGAGKTTLLRTISGLVRASQGAIRFEGRDITNGRTDHIVRMGIVQVPEGRMALAKLSVLENLLAAAAIRRDRDNVPADIEAVMTRFPILRERSRQLAGTLSGGQQQMLVIARALMARPRLLLLDEPSLGLAPVIADQVFEIIGEIRRQGVTILLVEQNAHRAMAMSDFTYVLELGRIAFAGPSAELKDDPRLAASYLGG
jgi:ABC-type branched-subunit amino acid transport system ATPase component